MLKSIRNNLCLYLIIIIPFASSAQDVENNEKKFIMSLFCSLLHTNSTFKSIMYQKDIDNFSYYARDVGDYIKANYSKDDYTKMSSKAILQSNRMLLAFENNPLDKQKKTSRELLQLCRNSFADIYIN